jgi:hypothetical protein
VTETCCPLLPTRASPPLGLSPKWAYSAGRPPVSPLLVGTWLPLCRREITFHSTACRPAAQTANKAYPLESWVLGPAEQDNGWGEQMSWGGW